MLANAVKLVANLSPLLCPTPSLPQNKREGQRGEGEAEREGETLLILIIASVEDTVCFHRGSLGTRCPKVLYNNKTAATEIQIFYFFFHDTNTQTFPP